MTPFDLILIGFWVVLFGFGLYRFFVALRRPVNVDMRDANPDPDNEGSPPW